jgi:RNA polymerase primary sigma factor
MAARNRNSGPPIVRPRNIDPFVTGEIMMPRSFIATDRGEQNPFELYLREINETPLLAAEEEKRLAHRIERGDPEARDHLVRANLRLVVSLARSYTGKGLCLADLIAEGNLGLLRAVEGFDPSMETRFSTYATYWIKQSIKRALLNTGKTIRVPAYMAELLTKWRRSSARLQEELGRAPTREEIAASLHLTKKKLKIIQKALRIHEAIQQGDGPDAGRFLEDTLADHSATAPDVGMTRSDELRQVLSLLGELDERSAAVLRLRYGLDGEEPKTLKEIGDHLGLTRERVRQIERDALGRLRENLEAA